MLLVHLQYITEDWEAIGQNDCLILNMVILEHSIDLTKTSIKLGNKGPIILRYPQPRTGLRATEWRLLKINYSAAQKLLSKRFDQMQFNALFPER